MFIFQTHGVVIGRWRSSQLLSYKDGNVALGSQIADATAIVARTNPGMDLEPVFFIMAARWLSTVRKLMPRSAAIILLGCPSRTSSSI